MMIPLTSCLHTSFPLATSMKVHRLKTSIIAMKVEIKSKKLIKLKPSMATPSTLRHHKIGFIDEFAPNMYVPLVLFFPPNINYNQNFVAQLEESLNKTLTLMHPLSGRYVKNIRAIDCNNQGAEFIQAQVDITLQDFLDFQVDPKEINKFIPHKWFSNKVTDPILATQVTMFRCGGLALGVEITHRVGDAFTLITFLDQWATLSRGDAPVEIVRTSFPSGSLFPSRGIPNMDLGFANSKIANDYVTKKLSFNESAILNMKAKATLSEETGSYKLSKGRLVSALIWKAFIGVDRAIHGHQRDSVLIQPINLRHKTATLIPENASGNFWGLIVTPCESTNMIKEVKDLTNLLEDHLKKAISDYSKVGNDNNKQKAKVLDSFSQFTNVSDTTNLIWLTSWSMFPFYNVNFVFGKPIWISFGCTPFKRGMVLLDDAQGNGVEAYVSMGINDVPYFEQDDDIKAFSV